MPHTFPCSGAHICNCEPALRPSMPSFALESALRRAWRTIGSWIDASRQRHALAKLDDRLLEDIGLTRRTAANEVLKPFWM